MPVYWLYSLVFVDDGITPTQLSALLGLWSMTAVVAEVPTGALADRWSRRRAVAAGGALEAAGFLAWIVSPNPAGYAVGFVLWGIGGSFASGALEALLYDGLHELRSDAEGAIPGPAHETSPAPWLGSGPPSSGCSRPPQ